jgi:hypothetical protein
VPRKDVTTLHAALFLDLTALDRSDPEAYVRPAYNNPCTPG